MLDQFIQSVIVGLWVIATALACILIFACVCGLIFGAALVILRGLEKLHGGPLL